MDNASSIRTLGPFYFTRRDADLVPLKRCVTTRRAITKAPVTLVVPEFFEKRGFLSARTSSQNAAGWGFSLPGRVEGIGRRDAENRYRAPLRSGGGGGGDVSFFTGNENTAREEQEMRPTFHFHGNVNPHRATFNHPASEWPTPARLAPLFAHRFFFMFLP